MTSPNSTMTLEERRGRQFMPSFCGNYQKMCVMAAMFTMLFCSICVGLLVNDLVDVTRYMDRWSYTRHSYTREVHNQTDTDSEHVPDEDKLMFDATITKVMYTALICELVLLVISSVALLKGVFQHKQSLIMTWILIVIATIIYGGAVIIRDFSLEGDSDQVYGKSVMYIIFIIAEFAFMKHIIKAFKEARRSTTARHGDVAVFDPRQPDNAIFNIAGSVPGVVPGTAQPDPASLFKLPTYDEVTTENNGETSSADERGKPPPYEPPPYEA